MFGVRALVERLRLFERNKVPWNLKVLGLAVYLQTSSLRRTARVLSEFCRVSKTAVRKRGLLSPRHRRNKLISMRFYRQGTPHV